MSFTRFHDDPARIRKQLQQSVDPCRYQLNRPGQGLDLPFHEDPQMRLQYWAANLQNNSIQLESELRGMNRLWNRDLVEMNDYKKFTTPSTIMASYSSAQPFVEESRASHPAWMFRDVQQFKWEFPFLDPQHTAAEKPFHHNIQTRILEKDSFVPIPRS